MSQALSFSTLDVFTKEPFRGNQLAIVHVPSHVTLNQQTKQAIAREFKFSETVFLHDSEQPEQPERSDYRCRVDIFTTTEELPFAGHPTIGTLVYMCRDAHPLLGTVTLITKAGPILGRFNVSLEIAEAEIPHDVRIHKSFVPREAVLSSQSDLDAHSTVDQTSPQLPLVSIVKGMSFILIPLSNGIETLDGQRQKILRSSVVLDDGWTPSFIGAYYFTVDSITGDWLHRRIRARMLEENVGEDPATGSAASCLATYLALQDGRDGVVYEFDIEQGVDMGRASLIKVKVQLTAGGKEVAKVILAGSAVLVTRGNLYVPKG